MKKIKFGNPLKTRRFYFALGCFLPLLFATCHEREKRVQREDLDNKISNLDRKIAETQDLRTANVPQNLKNTQARYNQASDSLNNNADILAIYQNQNDSLIARAFNNYAVRVGRDFQMSAFLSDKDITTFQKYITGLDSMDFIQEQARHRILQNKGSMHDLMYFIELVDFDSINSQLENKLAWNFYTDSTDTEPLEISVLCFENQHLNSVLGAEMRLLNRAWQSDNLQQELKQNDSLRVQGVENASDSEQVAQIVAKHDSVQNQIILEYSGMSEYEPNFSIPEFDSVRTQYMHNDSLINKYYNTFINMTRAEDSLEHYRQNVIHQRDSLVEKRNSLTR